MTDKGIPTVEIDVDTLSGDSTTVKLTPGDEKEFSASTVRFTVRALDAQNGK